MSAPEDNEPASPFQNKPPAGYIQKDYVRARDEGPRAEIDETPLPVHMGTNPKKQSMSFKVLQWMTDTENAPDDPEPPPQRAARRPARDPTVHNAEDDEMRFSGLHPKAAIPSKSFGRLQKIPGENQNHTSAKGQGHDEEEDDGMPDTLSAEEMTDRRYKGGHIPSKVFRTLQKAVGDDTPETPPPEQQNGDAVPAKTKLAPVPNDAAATDF